MPVAHPTYDIRRNDRRERLAPRTETQLDMVRDNLEIRAHIMAFTPPPVPCMPHRTQIQYGSRLAPRHYSSGIWTRVRIWTPFETVSRLA